MVWPHKVRNHSISLQQILLHLSYSHFSWKTIIKLKNHVFYSITYVEIPRANTHIQLSPTVSIVIGVCTALVIVSIVVIVLRIYCARKRNRDRRRRDKAATPLKTDTSEGCDPDEKNPDVIPQGNVEILLYVNKISCLDF